MSGIFPFQFPDAITGPDLQVWNNAAFDHDGGTTTWWDQCLDSNSSKENLSPVLENSHVPVKKVVPNSISKNGVLEEEEEREIDREIEEIEKEISRLSSKLRALKIEKAERKISKTVEKKGRIVAAKFMDNVSRRGLSMGPTEIFSGSKGKNSGITPGLKQGRRVSCFWRIQEVDELKVIKERGKSASLSPKERKSGVVGPGKKAVTTVGGKRLVGRKDDGVVGLIQPRTLFKDVGEKEKEKLLSNKKNGKVGRVVASRYNLGGGGGEVRKRSLPESEKEEGNKRRVSQGNAVGQSGRVKKKWDVGGSLGEGSVVTPLVVARDVLPKIRNLRCVNETPRDSGAAKRVVDLMGRKSYFCSDDDGGVGGAAAGDSVCQLLSFRDEDV